MSCKKGSEENNNTTRLATLHYHLHACWLAKGFHGFKGACTGALCVIDPEQELIILIVGPWDG